MTEEPVEPALVELAGQEPEASPSERSEESPATSVSEPIAPIAADSSPRPAPKRAGMITRLIQAIWLGSGVFLVLSAAAAFTAASNTTDAANVVGAILTRWHYIALLAPLLLMFLEWRRSRPVMLVILFIAVLFASFQALLDTRIRIIRAESFVPISSLSQDDPVRRQFGLLHGMSTIFLIGQVIAAGVAVATRE
jgi:hypothetical protein